MLAFPCSPDAPQSDLFSPAGLEWREKSLLTGKEAASPQGTLYKLEDKRPSSWQTQPLARACARPDPPYEAA